MRHAPASKSAKLDFGVERRRRRRRRDSRSRRWRPRRCKFGLTSPPALDNCGVLGGVQESVRRCRPLVPLAGKETPPAVFARVPRLRGSRVHLLSARGCRRSSRPQGRSRSSVGGGDRRLLHFSCRCLSLRWWQLSLRRRTHARCSLRACLPSASYRGKARSDGLASCRYRRRKCPRSCPSWSC